MNAVLISLLVSILKRLLTETFLARVIVYLLWELAKSSKFELDDKIVREIANSLNVPLNIPLKEEVK